MTIAQADSIADRIQSLPRLYDAPPTLSEGMRRFDFTYRRYPWMKTSLVGAPYLAEGSADNLYRVEYGFPQELYSSTITEWKATGVSPIHGSPRYITIDDLRMMAYVGIEYARAKLEGWRYRYGTLGETRSYFPRGCIVRLQDGTRYIHRVAGGFADPPGSGGAYSDSPSSYYDWAPMMRMPGFETFSSGGFDFPEEFEIPSDAYSGIVRLGTIEGQDDLIKFDIDRARIVSYSKGGDVFWPCVESGGMEIILSTAAALGEENLEDGLVVLQQNSTPIYYSWDSVKARQQGVPPFRDTRDPRSFNSFQNNPVSYNTLAGVDCNSFFAPLKKGVTYTVFARFSDAVLKKRQEKKLVTYIRTATRTVAPTLKTAAST